MHMTSLHFGSSEMEIKLIYQNIIHIREKLKTNLVIYFGIKLNHLYNYCTDYFQISNI